MYDNNKLNYKQTHFTDLLFLVKYEDSFSALEGNESSFIQKLPKFCEWNFSIPHREFLSLKYTIKTVPS